MLPLELQRLMLLVLVFFLLWISARYLRLDTALLSLVSLRRSKRH